MAKRKRKQHAITRRELALIKEMQSIAIEADLASFRIAELAAKALGFRGNHAADIACDLSSGRSLQAVMKMHGIKVIG